MIIYEIISYSTSETEAAGERFAKSFAKATYENTLDSKNKRQDLVAKTPPDDIFVALYGGLGAGKTAFVRGMARVIAPKAFVSSPTYTLVNKYENTETGDILYHFDMYRINNEDDLLSIGFYDYGGAVFVVEWSENIPFALPEKYYRVTITGSGENERSITIDYIGGAGYENTCH